MWSIFHGFERPAWYYKTRWGPLMGLACTSRASTDVMRVCRERGGEAPRDETTTRRELLQQLLPQVLRGLIYDPSRVRPNKTQLGCNYTKASHHTNYGPISANFPYFNRPAFIWTSLLLIHSTYFLSGFLVRNPIQIFYSVRSKWDLICTFDNQSIQSSPRSSPKVFQYWWIRCGKWQALWRRINHMLRSVQANAFYIGESKSFERTF